MWIAAQHLYGIYHDFKKTIIPTAYHDSNYSEDYECSSEMSARMADRPPTYDHSLVYRTKIFIQNYIFF